MLAYESNTKEKTAIPSISATAVRDLSTFGNLAFPSCPSVKPHNFHPDIPLHIAAKSCILDVAGISEISTEITGYPLRFRRDHPRRLVKLGESAGAVDAFGNRTRKRRAMSPTGPSRVIADSITAAAVRR